MSEKKNWRKIGLSAALGAAIGVGVEIGAEQIKKVDKADPDTSVTGANDPQVIESDKKLQSTMPETELSPAEEQKIKDWKRTGEVKKFIDKIYDEEPFRESTNENLIEQYNKLRNYLDEKIGHRFKIQDLQLKTYEDGVQNNYFNILPKKLDGSDGQIIRVEFRDDGTLSVNEEGLLSSVVIKQDENMADNLVKQVEKVNRMRDAARMYESGDYNRESYWFTLMKEGYSEEEIQYIINSKIRSFKNEIE